MKQQQNNKIANLTTLLVLMTFTILVLQSNHILVQSRYLPTRGQQDLIQRLREVLSNLEETQEYNQQQQEMDQLAAAAAAGKEFGFFQKGSKPQVTGMGSPFSRTYKRAAEILDNNNLPVYGEGSESKASGVPAHKLF